MIVLAKIKAKKGHEAEVEKTLADLVTKVQQEEGTLIYTLSRSKKDPSLFMVYEKYTDKAAFDFHVTTPYFQEAGGLFATLLDGPVDAEFYDEIAGVN